MLPTWFEIQTYAGRPVKTPVPPRTCVVLLLRDVPVETQTRRPQDVRVWQLAARVLDRVAALVAERHGVGDRVREAGLAEERHVEAETQIQLQVVAHAPVILDVGAGVEHFQRLNRLLLAGDVVVAHLEAIAASPARSSDSDSRGSRSRRRRNHRASCRRRRFARPGRTRSPRHSAPPVHPKFQVCLLPNR